MAPSSGNNSFVSLDFETVFTLKKKAREKCYQAKDNGNLASREEKITVCSKTEALNLGEGPNQRFKNYRQRKRRRAD